MNHNIPTLLLPTLAISLFSVPLGALMAFIMVISTPSIYNSQMCRYTLYLIMALALSYINLTKPIHSSDLGYYYWLYNLVEEKSFVEYMALIPKEPLYHLYNYILHMFTFGYFNAFMVVHTTICYMLVFSTYDIVVRNTEVDIKYALVAAAIFLLFIEFFFYTAQIVRQVVAGSVAIYGIAKNTYEKNKYSIWLIGLAGFIHASAFFFMLYYVIYFFRHLQFRKLFLLTISFLVCYKLLLGLLGNIFDDASTIGIAIRRGISGSNEFVSIGILPLLVCVVILPMSVIIIRKTENLSEKLFFIFPIALIVFILMNIDSPLFVLRFMEYTYMFIPLALVLYLAHTVRSFPLIPFTVILIFMLARFSIKLGTSDFSYISIFDYLSVGIPHYIFKIFNI